MLGRLRVTVLTVACLSLGSTMAVANERGHNARVVKREILAVFDSKREGTADATRIHRFAELPLNHLGYALRYHNMQHRLPSSDEVAQYAGVLTWFVGPHNRDDAWLSWLGDAMRAGVPLIVLGDLGVVVGPHNAKAANTVLARLGVRHTGAYVSPTDGSRASIRDGVGYQFECRLDPVLPDFPILDATGARSIGVEVELPAHVGGGRSTLVTIGERGAFAAFNYEFCHQSAPLHRGKWLIDPFTFFRNALAAPPFPVPDPTTVAGRRAYFSLVSSDGWSNPSENERQGQGRQIAAEVVARDLIEEFPDLPVTIDIRDSDVGKSGRKLIASQTLARRLLELAHVSRPGRRAVASKLARLDASYDSISNLAPLAVGGSERIFLTATSSERAYRTAELHGSTGFFSLRETLDRTETPRRLKPANINFHMQAGADRALLAILRQHLAAARTAPLAPVSANTYAEIADGFFTTTIEAVGQMRWRIGNRGQLQTVRLDRAAGREVDMLTSRGVLGYTHHNGALYVALDAAIDVAEVALHQGGAAPPASGLSLIDSRWRLRNHVRVDGRVTLEAEGYGLGEMNWRAPPGSSHRIIVRRDDSELWTGNAAADADGVLAFSLPVSAINTLTIEIEPEHR